MRMLEKENASDVAEAFLVDRLRGITTP